MYMVTGYQDFYKENIISLSPQDIFKEYLL